MNGMRKCCVRVGLLQSLSAVSPLPVTSRKKIKMPIWLLWNPSWGKRYMWEPEPASSAFYRHSLLSFGISPLLALLPSLPPHCLFVLTFFRYTLPSTLFCSFFCRCFFLFPLPLHFSVPRSCSPGEFGSERRFGGTVRQTFTLIKKNGWKRDGDIFPASWPCLV